LRNFMIRKATYKEGAITIKKQKRKKIIILMEYD